MLKDCCSEILILAENFIITETANCEVISQLAVICYSDSDVEEASIRPSISIGRKFICIISKMRYPNINCQYQHYRGCVGVSVFSLLLIFLAANEARGFNCKYTASNEHKCSNYPEPIYQAIVSGLRKIYIFLG